MLLEVMLELSKFVDTFLNMKKNRKGVDILRKIQGSKNIRTACKELGISRSQYYKLLQNAESAPAKTYEPSKMGVEVANKIQELALVSPFGCYSIYYKLMEENIKLSAVSVQKILNQAGLGSVMERLVVLEKKILADRTYILNAEQKEFLGRYNPALLELQRNIQAPGDLLTVFSYFLGRLPWLGKVYLYFGLDAYSGYVHAMLCYAPDKYLCADFLKDVIFPFYEQRGIKIKQVETSDDPEFFSYAAHPFSSFLRSMNGVNYQRTTVGGLNTNGFSRKWKQYLQTQIVPVLKKNKAHYLDLEVLYEDVQKLLKVYNEGSSAEARVQFQSYPFEQKAPLETLNQLQKSPN